VSPPDLNRLLASSPTSLEQQQRQQPQPQQQPQQQQQQRTIAIFESAAHIVLQYFKWRLTNLRLIVAAPAPTPIPAPILAMASTATSSFDFEDDDEWCMSVDVEAAIAQRRANGTGAPTTEPTAPATPPPTAPATPLPTAPATPLPTAPLSPSSRSRELAQFHDALRLVADQVIPFTHRVLLVVRNSMHKLYVLNHQRAVVATAPAATTVVISDT
jgi:hypothetical protein